MQDRQLERLGAGEGRTRFFTEHIEADAVHEQVMRRDVIGDLLEREPGWPPTSSRRCCATTRRCS